MALTLKQLREALKGSGYEPKPRAEQEFADLHTIEVADPVGAPQSNTAPTETASAEKTLHGDAPGERTPVPSGTGKVNSFFKNITGQTLPPNSRKQGDLKPHGSPSRAKGYSEAIDHGKKNITEGHDPIMVALEKIAAGTYGDGKPADGNHRITFQNGKTATVSRGTASSIVALSKAIAPERAKKMAQHIETGPMAFLKVAEFAQSSHV